MAEFSTERGHPYGVKPPGNAYFASVEHKQVRRRGLGRIGVFSDEMLLDMLAHLDHQSVCQLAQTSRAMYVYCHASDIWRDLTLYSFKSGIRYVHARPCTSICTLVLVYVTAARPSTPLTASIRAGYL